MERKDREHSQAEDAPQTGPLPETPEETAAGEPLPDVADNPRDPARIPGTSGRQTRNQPPSDEQVADSKEVLEGVDRADNEQRRVAQSPSESPEEPRDRP